MAAFNEHAEPRALVFGGTGFIGSAVVRALARRGIRGAFTYIRSNSRAAELAEETEMRAIALDLRDAGAIRSVIRDISPTAFFHCAARAEASRLVDISDDLWDDVLCVNARSAFIACRELAHVMTEGASVTLCVGPDAIQSAPSAPHFAASQAAIAGLVRAAARDLGRRGIRINAVAFGIMAGGSSSLLSQDALREAAQNAALRRLGTAEEAARALLWVALDGGYINGAIVPVAGGL